jgi:PAS domain S-box-containing protein
MGATDYVLKQRPRRLVSAIQRALTDLKQQKRRSEAEEKVLAQAQLLDLASDSISVLSLEGIVIFWNRGAERLYGYAPNEAEGRHITDLIYRSPAESYEQARRGAIAEGQWQGELEHVSKDRQRIVVSSRWTVVANAAGKPERFLCINTDITERKQLEAQFLRAQRLESIGTLASGIAHDLNNILAPIFMASEILRSEQLTPDGGAMLDIIQNSAQRGADIVKQVLTFVRGSEGKRTSLALPYLVKEICKVASETFPKNISVRFSIDPSLWLVEADPTQMHQVLMNLCINARDAMPNGGLLTVSAKNVTADGKSSVQMEVADTGTGIPQEIIDKIFDPFFTTKDAGKGTGLGLSTVLGIVKSHAGTVHVESKPGEGTKFQVALPAVLDSSKGDARKNTGPVPRGHGETVLVVDDEAEIRNLAAEALRRNGYEVISAQDGASGIVQFVEQKQKIALVITDLMMPGVDGVSLVKTVQAIKPDMKIIITSGFAEGRPLPEGSRLIRKPFSANELLRAVQEEITSTVS